MEMVSGGGCGGMNVLNTLSLIPTKERKQVR